MAVFLLSHAISSIPSSEDLFQFVNNQKYINEFTPLMFAIRAMKPMVVKLLLSKHFQLDPGLREATGRDTIMIAATSTPDILKMLLDHGDYPINNIISNSGSSVIHDLVYNYYGHVGYSTKKLV